MGMHRPSYSICSAIVCKSAIVSPSTHLPVLFITRDQFGQKPSSSEQRTRLWWCTTRAFAYLPIHAAGIYDKEDIDCCSDYVTSSYTPTLQALINARQSYRTIKRSEARILLGATPHPYTGTRIPATVEEIRYISKIVPKKLVIPLDSADDVLADPEARGMSVASALNRLFNEHPTIMHIASHGQQDSLNPLESGFLLRDGKLTMLEIMRHPVGSSRETSHDMRTATPTTTTSATSTFLAFLSACETARVTGPFAHQTIHLAASMLFAGLKSVVATMWYVRLRCS